MNDLGEFLLVGTSASFASPALLKRKLDTYVAGLEGCNVVAINDVKGLVRGYFGDRVVESLSSTISLVEKRRLVKAASWAIWFWDGTGVSDFIYLSALYEKKVKTIPVSTARAVNKDRGEEFDVYIGRGTPWGNPFAIGDGIDRATSVEMYKEYFQKKFVEDEEGKKAILSLRGKVMGCHCKPSACHGDIIADYLNGLEE